MEICVKLFCYLNLFFIITGLFNIIHGHLSKYDKIMLLSTYHNDYCKKKKTSKNCKFIKKKKKKKWKLTNAFTNIEKYLCESIYKRWFLFLNKITCALFVETLTRTLDTQP